MVTSVNSKMTAIADAIRNLLDISGTMGLDAMASNISSITKRGAVAGTISTKSEQYIIPAGYHNGNGTVGIDVAEQAKIIAENIKNGVTILGVSGTASGDAYAVITVTYPAGSVCTCTDGSKTLKLKDTSGQGFFLIPYAATWTVKCYDGADYDSSPNKKSKNVEITAEGQSVSVTLNYGVYLFKEGRGQITPFTSTNETNGTVSIGTNEIVLNYSSNSNGQVAVKTVNAVDLSNYSKLIFDAICNRTEKDNDWTKAVVAVDTNEINHALPASNLDAYTAMNPDGVRREYTIDISGFNTGYYIGAKGLIDGTIYNIWLEE